MDLSLLLVNFQLFPFWKQFSYRGNVLSIEGQLWMGDVLGEWFGKRLGDRINDKIIARMVIG